MYVDGANLNALVGLAKPGRFGADVSHLNLHKTFCIPHGGGGPGVGPGRRAGPPGAVPAQPPAAPRGRSVRAGRSSGPSPPRRGVGGHPADPVGLHPLMGGDGLTAATEVAILNANYMAHRLDPHYPVLYTGRTGPRRARVHHRHPPDHEGDGRDRRRRRQAPHRLRLPRADDELPGGGHADDRADRSREQRRARPLLRRHDRHPRRDRRVASGEWPSADSPLRNAPHPAADVAADAWDRAVHAGGGRLPVPSLRTTKYWPPVGRIDGGYGDRNLVCSCPPIEEYA